MLIKVESLQKALNSLRKSDMLGGGKVPSGMPSSTKEANGGLQDEDDADLPDELNTTNSMSKGLPMPSDEDDDDGYGDEEDGDPPMGQTPAPMVKSFSQLAKQGDANVFKIDGWLKNVTKSIAQSNTQLVAGVTALGQVNHEQFQQLGHAVLALGQQQVEISNAVNALTKSLQTLLGQPSAPPQAQFQQQAPPQYTQPPQQSQGMWQQPANQGWGQPHQPMNKSFPQQAPQQQGHQQAPYGGGLGNIQPQQMMKALVDLAAQGRISPEEVSVYETSFQEGQPTLSAQAQQQVQQYFGFGQAR